MPGKLDGLQFARLLAAFSVVVFHYFQQLDVAFDMKVAFPLGAAGVDVFFIVSGFVVALSAERLTGRPWAFLLRRLARIVPLYWLLTLGVFMLAMVMPSLLNTPEIGVPELVKSLLFVPFEKASGLVQPVLFLGWTLNYEMFFYVLLFIGMLTPWPKRAAGGALLAFVALGPFLPLDNVALRFYSEPIVLEFVGGMVLFEIYRRRGYRLPGGGWPMIGLGLALLIAAQSLFGPDAHRAAKWGLPALVIVVGAINLRLGQGALPRAAVTFGDASYSIYLMHPYILAACTKLVIPAVGVSWLSLGLFSSLAFVLVFGLAYLSYRLVERPTQRWAKRVVDARAAAGPVFLCPPR